VAETRIKKEEADGFTAKKKKASGLTISGNRESLNKGRREE